MDTGWIDATSFSPGFWGFFPFSQKKKKTLQPSYTHTTLHPQQTLKKPTSHKTSVTLWHLQTKKMLLFPQGMQLPWEGARTFFLSPGLLLLFQPHGQPCPILFPSLFWKKYQPWEKSCKVMSRISICSLPGSPGLGLVYCVCFFNLTLLSHVCSLRCGAGKLCMC